MTLGSNYPCSPIHLDADLSPDVGTLGIKVHPAAGPAHYWTDGDHWWKIIGHHTVDRGGTIEVWPVTRTQLADDEYDTLCGFAADAFVNRPSAETGWRATGDGDWHCSISVEVDGGDGLGARAKTIHDSLMRCAQQHWQPAA
ncbi:hypothetical protein [Nocardia rhizosphaerae]|uniref:DUF317 domain-containing protein n=1 Tax=Nocardia rhizosphaerae TaxID=1691571 RepID=A0ABV8LDX5_9NOCA